MRTCQGCATEYAEGAAHCPRCGLGATEILPALPEPQAFRVGPGGRQIRTTPDDDGDEHGEELLDARRRGRRGPLLWIAAAVVVGGVALGIWLSGSSGHGQPSSALASIAAEHGGASLPVTVPAERTTPPPTGLVGVAPAVAHAQGLAQARTLLNSYFTAINNHRDYAGWAATLVPSPGRATRRQYEGYRTTRDSDISINTLQKTADGWAASVSFTSRQDAKLGSGHDCLKWSIRYVLRPNQNSLRIDLVASSQLNKLTC